MDNRQSRKLAVREGVLSLLSVLQFGKYRRNYTVTGEPLFDAAQIVADEIGERLVKPAGEVPVPSSRRIRHITRVSGLQMRKIAFESEWWKFDTCATIAFILPKDVDERTISDEEIIAQSKPVAVVHTGRASFAYIDPETGTETPIKSDENPLSRLGFTLFKPFDDTRPVGLHDVIRFVTRGRGGDVLLIMLAGILTGLLGMLGPIFTGWIVDSVIPEANRSLLFQLTVVLIAIALGNAALSLVHSYSFLRIEGWGTLNVEAAIWDRLVRLPCGFFRGYNTGDLVARAFGINQIRKILSDSAMTAIVSGLFCLPSLILMFWYSRALALTGIALLMVSGSLQIVSAACNCYYQRKILALNADTDNDVFQFFSGIEKLRSSFSEDYLFRNWAKQFSELSLLSLNAQRINAVLAILAELAVPISTVLFFGFGMYLNRTTEGSGFTAGVLIAFIGAFGSVRSGFLGMTGTLVQVSSILPIWERISPILNELPESSANAETAPELTGRIEVSHVSFGYPGTGTLVLDDVSFTVETGQFIAVVGESGAGKSTLLRLLLGFEKPVNGSIFYDGADVSNVDIHSLRQQFGVVLQTAGLFDGNLFSNIAGGTGCTRTEAWEAAEIAGIAEDIRKMPMQMSTFVSATGGTISGGQRQRIMIARAIVGKPKILFLDEATSALDNISQQVVIENIDKIEITRIVIAHRLSTIRNADKVIVLQEGKIVQEGSFDELLNRDGLFKGLMRRQMAGDH